MMLASNFLSCKEQMAHIQDIHAKYVLQRKFFIVIELSISRSLKL